jgi:hypothetical protein
LNLKNISMSYVNYERDIITKYKIKLIGWPTAVKFASPSEIGTVDDIRLLRQALKVGDCKWMVLTRRQQQAHIETLAARVAAGEVVGKKRKQRSDKGKTRKKSSKARGRDAGEKNGIDGENDGSENEDIDQTSGGQAGQRPLKKKRKTVGVARKLPPTVKSHEFIEDSDREDSDFIDDGEV